MDQTFEREMTISHREFFRILPKAIQHHRYQQNDNCIIVSLNNDDEAANVSLTEQVEIHITLSKEGRLEIASLSLPSTIVTFQLKNVAESTKKSFFHHFDRAYQRGGG